jgi:hypothetical protein
VGTISCNGSTFTKSTVGLGSCATPVGQDVTLNLSAASNGYTITVHYDAVDFPNRFTVYANTSVVATSGWVGSSVTNCAGPWNTFGAASGNLVFTYDSTKSYKVYVELAPRNSVTNETYQLYALCSAPTTTTTTSTSTSTTTTTTTARPTTTTTTTAAPTTTTTTTAATCICESHTITNNNAYFYTDCSGVLFSGGAELGSEICVDITKPYSSNTMGPAGLLPCSCT